MHLMTPGQDDEAGSSTVVGGGLKSVLAPVWPFVHWWLKELREMLPLSLRRIFSERRLLVRASQGKVCLADPSNPEGEEVCHGLRSRKNAEESTLPTQPVQRCDLLLDDSLVLVRELELPLEAEATLRKVLLFSMDRYTPFSERDVLFDYKVIRRDGVKRKIALKLYVAPREGVEPIMRQLADMGIAPATVDVCTDVAAGMDNGRVGINLLSAEQRSGSGSMGRSNRLLALSALVLLLIAVVSPFIQRHQAVARLESEVDQLRGQVRQAESDHMELLKRVERMRLIRERNSAKPATLDVLLELTRLMPDDAWAGQVAIKSGRVRLTGEASAASELLTHLSKSSIFSDPKFEAPLTQNPRTGRERFVISLAIRGGYDGT